jgi:phytoene synthase
LFADVDLPRPARRHRGSGAGRHPREEAGIDAGAAGPRQPIDTDYAYCEELLRREDRDRWLASLFVPREPRRHMHALYAFSLEVARVRQIVSEPLLGEIRFQWWRDALEGAADAGEAKANPVAAALLDTIARFDLPKAPVLELISARAAGLYGEPMDSVAALEAYTEATCSNLLRLAALILDREELAASREAADHAGIAYGITGLIRALPWHRARGQAFVPAEILQAHGASRDDFAAGASEAVLAVIADLLALARAHLYIFYAKLPALPDKSRPAFLPVCLCEPYLRLMEKPGYDPFKTAVELPQWRRQWILWRAARRWG